MLLFTCLYLVFPESYVCCFAIWSAAACSKINLWKWWWIKFISIALFRFQMKISLWAQIYLQKIGFMWQVWNFERNSQWVRTQALLVGVGKGGPDLSFPLEPVVCSDPLIRYQHCLMESKNLRGEKKNAKKYKLILLTRSINQDGVDLWFVFSNLGFHWFS